MTWLTWRQFRSPAAVAFGALAVIAVVLGATGPHLASAYRAYQEHLRACTASGGDCSSLTSTFLLHNDEHTEAMLSLVLLFVPGLIGVFWGAPLLARELESGTYRLAWTQGVTRTRWLATKVAVVGTASVVAAGLFSLMLGWWASPLDTVGASRFVSFSQRGIVPVGYAAFGFALGLTLGLLIRRTLPAMAVTLVAFTAARVAVADFLRPHFAAPLHRYSIFALPPGLGGSAPPAAPGTTAVATKIGQSTGNPADWVLSSRIVNPAGHNAVPVINCNTPAGDRPQDAVGKACIAHGRAYLASLRQFLTYQPARRFWGFQWDETAIFVGAALLLIGFCLWWIRYRIT